MWLKYRSPNSGGEQTLISINMKSLVCLLAVVGCAFASYLPDDGQWRPELDGSILGSGRIQWGLEDGSWKPAHDNSIAGQSPLYGRAIGVVAGPAIVGARAAIAAPAIIGARAAIAAPIAHVRTLAAPAADLQLVTPVGASVASPAIGVRGLGLGLGLGHGIGLGRGLGHGLW